MGINIILPLIIGMALMVSLGSQVTPSFVEQMKIAKVENRTISNQNAIKEAIIRYIKIEKKAPLNLEELKIYGLLKDYHESNFFDGGYSFEIEPEKGILKIFTRINDDVASKYFTNSFKNPNKPTCIEPIGESCNMWETSYFLDNIIFDILNGISKEETIENKNTYTYMEQIFVEDNVGKKEYYIENPPKNGDKDYVVDFPNNKVIEYEYDGEKWNEKTTLTNFGIGPAMGVEIKNDNFGNEKIFCNAYSIKKEVFVVNQNTGLLELIWVAPNNTSDTRGKIFDRTVTNMGVSISTDAIYKPNNICTSNLTSIIGLLGKTTKFNQPLNRWDVSNVTNMDRVFSYATSFNQDLSSWDVSNAISMHSMFGFATSFNQDLSSWDVSNVTDMGWMFHSASNFNQSLNDWDVSNVIDMDYMFPNTTSFNQNLSSWCVSKIKYEPIGFSTSSPLSLKPIWGTCPNP